MVMRIYKGVEFPYRAITALTTLTDDDYQIDITANDVTVTLISAVGREGRQLSIKNSGTGTVTVDGDGTETIEGSLTQILDQYDNMVISSNGADWIVI